jgi:hypothetical protein
VKQSAGVQWQSIFATKILDLQGEEEIISSAISCKVKDFKTQMQSIAPPSVFTLVTLKLPKIALD